MKAVVFGEIALDIIVEVTSPPEQVPARGNIYHMSYGGMGANQAITLGRLGIDTFLIGRVGSDKFGQDMLQNLLSNGINIKGIIKSVGSTPIAVLAVDSAGNYYKVLVFVEGVNKHVADAELQQLLEVLNEVRVGLFQLGFPMQVVIPALRAAKEKGVITILDPFPLVVALPTELYSSIDIITPNQFEAEQLVGFPVHDVTTATKAANILHSRGIGIVIITMAAQGAFCSTIDEKFTIPSYKVPMTDNVGAGDAFNGGLAAGLALGLSIREAVSWGVGTSALSVTGRGSQSALPTKEDLLSFLRGRPEAE